MCVSHIIININWCIYIYSEGRMKMKESVVKYFSNNISYNRAQVTGRVNQMLIYLIVCLPACVLDRSIAYSIILVKCVQIAW